MRIGALIISYLVNPLLITTLLFFLLAKQFQVIVIPNAMLASILTGVLFVVTFLLPVVSLFVMQKMGIISDIMVSERGQRTVPLIYTALIYMAAGIVIFKDNRMSDFRIAELLFFVSGLMVLAGIITQYWKISAHALGVGGVVGVLLRLVFGFYGMEYVLALSLAVLVSGIVMSARIYLGAHTLAQVTVGFLVGLIYAFLASYFII